MNRLVFILILMLFVTSAVAANFGCDTYYLNSSNTLNGISVFNAKYIGDKYTAELAPTSESQESDIVTQYWNLDPYKDSKLFVKCIYKDNAYVVKEIPMYFNMCKLKFIDNQNNLDSTKSPDFICYKRGEKDGKCSPKT